MKIPPVHEEADTRLLLHVVDCAKHGYRRVMLRTVDTDVIVIAIGMYQQMNVTELWIEFGTGKFHRYVAVHEIVATLSPEKATAMLAFHAIHRL